MRFVFPLILGLLLTLPVEAEMHAPPSIGAEKQSLHCQYCRVEGNLLQSGGLASIRFFQRVLTRADGARCRFYPSCSEFGRHAVAARGFFVGSLLTADRLLRDHPYNDSRYPVITMPSGVSLLYDPLQEHLPGSGPQRVAR